MPRLIGDDPDLPVVFSAARARAAGLTSGQIRHRVRSGRWTPIGRGHYRRSNWAAQEPDDDFRRARLDHVHRVVVAARSNPHAVVGFDSAAILHQLPLLTPPPAEVTLIVPPGSWTGRRSGIVMRQGTLRAEEIVAMPIRVTSPSRTWLDIARTQSLGSAFAVGDAGLRAATFDSDSLREAVASCGSRRGSRRAALALQHLSAQRESVLESGSWAYFVEHGIPLPYMQVDFRSARGLVIGRVDFWWKFADLIGECDGRLKYASAESLYREKAREDALREQGHRFVRWGWRDLGDAGLADRLRRALAPISGREPRRGSRRARRSGRIRGRCAPRGRADAGRCRPRCRSRRPDACSGR